ncbi:hypothetical protein [Burkholderia lata]|uniref:hypothetical protein n=1 Tax=Burkholderia lata (strain ATCC 17760 / DSM 23089 / LMG 22485 / NCIMB 9086 / R18194 / 383) TaxID=482957 RepID=UPI0014548ED0|nr:hypothetical protein [Burkholderia lata]VWB89002.1 hypothetical protein BLA15816_04279 [Burkholderia lata]
MRAIHFFTRHTTPETSPNSDASKQLSPAAGQTKHRLFSFSLPGMKSRNAQVTGGNSAVLNTTDLSMPSRGALKRIPAPQNALGKLMHAERKSDLTKKFMKSLDSKRVKLATKAQVLHEDGRLGKASTKRTSTHALSKPSVKLSNTRSERILTARLAAKNLAGLIEKHPAGTFDADLRQGSIPREAIEGIDINKLNEIDEIDVMFEHQESQRSTHAYLLHGIALNLKKLGATSSGEAQALLHRILQNPDAWSALSQDPSCEFDEITEATPHAVDVIREAYGQLPERLRGEDIIEMFDSIGKPHPRQLMAMKGQNYLDTIDERLAEINARGSQSRE